MYNCLGSMVLRSSIGVFIGVIFGAGTGWEERITVGMVPGGEHVASMGN